MVEAKRKPPEQNQKELHHEVVPESQRQSIACASHLAPRRGAVILPASTGGLRFATTTGYFLSALQADGLIGDKIGERLALEGEAGIEPA